MYRLNFLPRVTDTPLKPRPTCAQELDRAREQRNHRAHVVRYDLAPAEVAGYVVEDLLPLGGREEGEQALCHH